MDTLDPTPRPPLTFAVHLSTTLGPIYVASDDTVAADLRTEHPETPVLSRSEIDGILSLACRIAPPDYLRLTLWRELHALLALKRTLPAAGLTSAVPHQHHPQGCGLSWCSTCYPPAPEPTEAEHEQLELLE